MSENPDIRNMILYSEEQTEALGEKIADFLQQGDTVLLYGEPGSGKTALTRGIARGLGTLVPVQSPTFTIANEYPIPDGKLVHMDLYRLDRQQIENLGLDEYFGENICVVEWPEDLQFEGNALTARLSFNTHGREVILSAVGKDTRRWEDAIRAIVGD